MAAFVEGTLAPAEVETVAGHLRDCAECRDVVAGAAAFELDEAQPSRNRRWWLSAAAIVAAMALGTPLLRTMLDRGAQTPLAHLIATAPRTHRSVEARLSGFAWARLQPPTRGNAVADPAELQLAGAAGDVLATTANEATPESRQVRGAALLLIGRRADAIAELERAANESADAHIWNDLAAARYAFAIDDEHPAVLPLALAAANRAATLAPASAEAHFNRALILERLGIREQARTAWRRYLELEPSSGWSVEAREHLRALDAAANDAATKRDEPRVRGEALLFAEWADAEAAHDGPRAAAALTALHAIAGALATQRGEHLLADAVAAIDAAKGETRAALIEAHRLHRDGRIAFSRREAGVAEAKLLRAAALFARGRSPMAHVATYYAASAAFTQHRGGEAQATLRQLRTSIDDTRYRALAAQIDWSLAVAANAEGDWGAGARLADRAAATFRAIGEEKNALVADSIAAAALDLTGGADAAWQRRIRLCTALDAPADRARRATDLRIAAMALERFGHADGAAAILEAAAADLRDDPALLAAVLTQRARLAEGDRAGGEQILTSAREAAARVRDGALREALDVQLDVAEAMIRRGGDARASIAGLDRAIAFLASSRLRQELPDAYVQRGRAHRAAGDVEAAIVDYAAALREIEAQRQTIGDGVLRLRFLDTAAMAIDESVELHLGRGAVAEAFAIVDAAHAGATSPRALPQLAPGTALIEYALLPHALVAFCLADGQLTAQQVAIDRNALADRIAAFARRMRERADVGAEAGALDRLLIAP
ncbi:MAG TPA: hypothetical protein VN605_13575, partial [Thermoanaerobaculia bacterium]|nr:hypothetical protein [Thermoanaerobaculia bacterium]